MNALNSNPIYSVICGWLLNCDIDSRIDIDIDIEFLISVIIIRNTNSDVQIQLEQIYTSSNCTYGGSILKLSFQKVYVVFTSVVRIVWC